MKYSVHHILCVFKAKKCSVDKSIDSRPTKGQVHEGCEISSQTLIVCLTTLVIWLLNSKKREIAKLSYHQNNTLKHL